MPRLLCMGCLETQHLCIVRSLDGLANMEVAYVFDCHPDSTPFDEEWDSCPLVPRYSNAAVTATWLMAMIKGPMKMRPL